MMSTVLEMAMMRIIMSNNIQVRTMMMTIIEKDDGVITILAVIRV